MFLLSQNALDKSFSILNRSSDDVLNAGFFRNQYFFYWTTTRLTINSSFQFKYAVESNLFSMCSSINVFYSTVAILVNSWFAGKNETYELLFIVVRSIEPGPSIRIGLQHYPDRSTVHVECHRFISTHHNQTCVLHQNSSGWHHVSTTPYCVKNPYVDMISYVQECVGNVVGEVCARTDSVGFFFQLARLYKDVRKPTILKIIS